MHITVCICTYRRPQLLQRLLVELSRQNTHGAFTYSVAVCDNDEEASGKTVVEAAAKHFEYAITYAVEARRNIAHARNKALENASGDLIAFIDDDEFPVPDWLYNHVKALTQTQASGVLGPVRPHFDCTPPSWVIKGRFCERPEHDTGFLVPLSECRTGNVVFKRGILEGLNPVFLPQFGTGGEDVNFFCRMMERDHKFVWCNEAVVYETVPESRLTRTFMIRRALLRGANSLTNPKDRVKSILKSVVAFPLYTLMLPFLQLAGHHHFMKFFIKWCDHTGRLFSTFGVKLVKERQM
jgi:succinoglycan biosynthesis protein ExoM